MIRWYIRTEAFLTLLGIRGLTQTDLAALAGLNTADLSAYVRREKPIGIKRMTKLRLRLNIMENTVLDFFEPVGGDESPFRKSVNGILSCAAKQKDDESQDSRQ